MRIGAACFVAVNNSDGGGGGGGLLVLALSLAVLAISLGLVTCVVNHYRRDTAADPHDAAQTPTTAPVSNLQL